MSAQILRTDYDFVLLARIRKGSAYYDLTGATIKASLINATKTAELITDTSQSDTADDADWANGLIAVEFADTQTTGLTAGKAFVEIAITKDGKRLPVNHIPVEIELGYTIS